MPDVDISNWSPVAQVAYAVATAAGIVATYIFAMRRNKAEPAAAVDESAIRKDFEDAISATARAFDARFDQAQALTGEAIKSLISDRDKIGTKADELERRVRKVEQDCVGYRERIRSLYRLVGQRPPTEEE